MNKQTTSAAEPLDLLATIVRQQSQINALKAENERLRSFAEHCESVRRNFADNSTTDQFGAAYHIIFMSGKAQRALECETKEAEV